jgi:hypothetical protein
MRRMYRLLFALLAAMLAAPALAQDQPRKLPIYRFNREAQLTCPNDQVVWLNTATGGFYRRGQNGYASTMTGPGGFVCRGQAEKAGRKPGIDFGEQDMGQQNYRVLEPPPKGAPAQ